MKLSGRYLMLFIASIVLIGLVATHLWSTRLLQKNKALFSTYQQLISVLNELTRIESAINASTFAGEAYLERLQKIVPNSLNKLSEKVETENWKNLEKLLQDSSSAVEKWKAIRKQPNHSEFEKYARAQAVMSLARTNDEINRIVLGLTQEINQSYRDSEIARNWSTVVFDIILLTSLGLFYVSIIHPLIKLAAHIRSGKRSYPLLAGVLTGSEIIELTQAHFTNRKTLAEFADELQKHREQLEELVKDRTTELQEANEELETFAYSVSHDLRSPLRGVDGYSKLLLQDHAGELNGDGRFMLAQVRESALQMGQMIDDLLAFSRMGRREMRFLRCDLKAIAHDLFQEFQAGYPERNLRFEVQDLPDCAADPAMAKEVLRNLIENAVKYTKMRDEAHIEVGSQLPKERKEAENQTPVICYFVRDNGAGFDPRYKHKLFKVFQRLHRAEEYNGTGIGLALVKRIIDRHNGNVWADGEPDKGATFYFTLPVFMADG